MFYLLLGAFICFFSIVSLLIKEKLYMSEAMVATLFGAIVGPFVLKFFHPFDSFGQSLGMITLEVSRIVIAVQVMACGIDLPKDYIWKEKKFPNMIVKWVVSGLGIYWIIGMPFLEALVIAACLTPTDPVLANSIVKGKFAERHIPENVRLILSAESGMNDGLGTPFLFLALYLMRYPTTGGAIGAWLWRVVIYQIVVGALVGVVMAMAALWILKIAVKRDWIDRESLVFFWLALAITIMGVVSLYGGDDILAVFIAGNVLSWDGWINEQVKGAHFQETIDYFLNLSYFIYFGAVLPWSHIGKAISVIKLVLIALWMLFIRRLPVVMALSPWVPALRNVKEAFFAGWFGPMGASAIFYGLIAKVYLEVDEHPLMEIVMFVVLTSIFVHGGSVPLFQMGLSYQEKMKARRGEDLVMEEKRKMEEGESETTAGDDSDESVSQEAVEVEGGGKEAEIVVEVVEAEKVVATKTKPTWTQKVGGWMTKRKGGELMREETLVREETSESTRTLAVAENGITALVRNRVA
ncbi:Sodium/hydrogen exchanger family-domain-containing protein [Chytridium lagenaria]|nr:Sodium/hydrogen exchanger family-domain-containing protein [Chytridium lagenaria]